MGRGHDIPPDLVTHLRLHDLRDIGDADRLVGGGRCGGLDRHLLRGGGLGRGLLGDLRLLGGVPCILLGLTDQVCGILLGQDAALNEPVDQVESHILGGSHRGRRRLGHLFSGFIQIRRRIHGKWRKGLAASLSGDSGWKGG